MTENLLIIDASASQQHIVDILQRSLLYSVTRTQSCQEAIHWIRAGKQPQPALILMSTGEAVGGEQEFMRNLKEVKAHIPVVAVIPYGHDEQAVPLMKAGACDYITKPVTIERLKATLDIALKMQRLANYNAWLERRMVGHVEFSDIIGNSPMIKEAVRMARHATSAPTPVWIEGEAGSGKELLARAIHGGSNRAGKPFVSVNCAMLSEEAAEVMLFGQDRNAQGEAQFVIGKFREASGGTLLLDEIGSLKPAIQQRLLSLLETGTITPLGSPNKIKPDVRIISASSIPLETLMNNGGFSHTLQQKLKTQMIVMPALRYRKEDIRMLADHFLAMYCAAEQKYIRGITPQAMEWLAAQPWPGNVHEMASTLQRSIILCRQEMLDVADLQATTSGDAQSSLHEKVVSVTGWLDAQGRMKPLKSVQEEAIRFALEHSNGCMTQAAKSLGIGRSTLYRKLGELSRDSYTSRANHTTRPMMNVSSADRS